MGEETRVWGYLWEEGLGLQSATKKVEIILCGWKGVEGDLIFMFYKGAEAVFTMIKLIIPLPVYAYLCVAMLILRAQTASDVVGRSSKE